MSGAGWHPDPSGRFELRYHNGRTWTADVASEGRRFVDPDGARPAHVASPEPSSEAPRNGIATASMIVAIVGVSIAWLPLLVVIGVVLGVIALVLGIVGLRRARAGAGGSGQAIAGIAVGGAALLAGVLGTVLSVIVLSELDAYRSPAAHEARIDSCRLVDETATATGTLTNLSAEDASFSVRIEFSRAGTDNAHRSTRVDVDDVAGGSSATFSTSVVVELDAVDCRVAAVDGPLPFGIAIE